MPNAHKKRGEDVKVPFEIKGYWWVTPESGNKISGTLSYSQDEGIILELAGRFPDAHVGAYRPPVILGESLYGKPVTIVAPILQSYSSEHIAKSAGTSSFMSDLVFVGAHFGSEEEIILKDIMASYTDLDDWVKASGFNHKRKTGDEEIVIRYQTPDPVTVTLTDDIEVGVCFTGKESLQAFPHKEAKVVQITHLIVSAKQNDLPFGVLRQFMDRFSALLQFGAQRVVYPINVTCHSRTKVQKLDEHIGVYSDIEIYYTPVEPYRQQRAKHWSQMFFVFEDLDEENIRQWFQVYEQHKTRIELYRTLFYTNRLFLDTKFLYIAQALESLHGVLFDSNFLPARQFKERLYEALISVPDHLQQWVKGALSADNNKRFKQRMCELLEAQATIMQQLILNPVGFAERVRDTRNELVHHGQKKGTFREAKEMLCAIILLTYLFEAYLLQLMGLQEEKIEDIYEKRIKDYLMWGIRL